MGSRKVTIKDIAAEAGVSVSLVSFVMNNRSEGRKVYRVSRETAQRILEVAERLDYQPNNAARTLRSGKTRTIGVIVSDISNKFFADIARCIEDRAYEGGYTVLFGSTDENPRKLENLMTVFSRRGVDGLIVVPCEGADEAIRSQARQEIPIVLLDREVPRTGLSSVVLNNCKAGIRITESLVDRGYTRIEMISYSMQLSNIREREEGYRRSMALAGLETRIRIHHVHHDRMEEIDPIVRGARERGVEAFVFATNTLATNGLTAIHRNGWHVPEDFAIACFDSNEAYDIYGTTVAYVRQPIEEFGHEALALLIARIKERDLPPTRLVLEPRIVEQGGPAIGAPPTPGPREKPTEA